MTAISKFPFPRRYNSLRLLGFDYASPSAIYSVTLKTDASRPVFADIRLVKGILAILLNDKTQARIRLLAYVLLPDHLHLVASVKKTGKKLSDVIGAFESLTTQVYWKRSHQIIESQSVMLPPARIEKSRPDEAKALLDALMNWRASLRPETMELKNWPRIQPGHFLSKQLWQRSLHDHIIRNDADLRETIEYVLLNPVRRGYVSRAQFYPFSGFGISEADIP
ncbi:MAG: REP-associated tyrosine transposase [Blastocatellia bacterium]